MVHFEDWKEKPITRRRLLFLSMGLLLLFLSLTGFGALASLGVLGTWLSSGVAGILVGFFSSISAKMGLVSLGTIALSIVTSLSAYVSLWLLNYAFDQKFFFRNLPWRVDDFDGWFWRGHFLKHFPIGDFPMLTRSQWDKESLDIRLLKWIKWLMNPVSWVISVISWVKIILLIPVTLYTRTRRNYNPYLIRGFFAPILYPLYGLAGLFNAPYWILYTLIRGIVTCGAILGRKASEYFTQFKMELAGQGPQYRAQKLHDSINEKMKDFTLSSLLPPVYRLIKENPDIDAPPILTAKELISRGYKELFREGRWMYQVEIDGQSVYYEQGPFEIDLGKNQPAGIIEFQNEDLRNAITHNRIKLLELRAKIDNAAEEVKASQEEKSQSPFYPRLTRIAEKMGCQFNPPIEIRNAIPPEEYDTYDTDEGNDKYIVGEPGKAHIKTNDVSEDERARVARGELIIVLIKTELDLILCFSNKEGQYEEETMGRHLLRFCNDERKIQNWILRKCHSFNPVWYPKPQWPPNPSEPASPKPSYNSQSELFKKQKGASSDSEAKNLSTFGIFPRQEIPKEFRREEDQHIERLYLHTKTPTGT